MQEPPDYVLVLPDKSEANPKKYCPRCEVIQDINNFGIYLTPLQAKARGYSGTRRIRDTSAKHCKKCREEVRMNARKKRPNAKGVLVKPSRERRYTPKKLKTLVALDLMNETVAKGAIAQIYERAGKQKSTALKKYWDKVRKRVWEVNYTAARKEADSATRSMRYAQERDIPVLEDFYGQYRYLCDMVVDYVRLRRGHKSGTNAPAQMALLWAQMKKDSLEQVDDITDEAKQLRDDIVGMTTRVKAVWNSLDPEMTQRARVPYYLAPPINLPEKIPTMGITFREDGVSKVTVTKYVPLRPRARGRPAGKTAKTKEKAND